MTERICTFGLRQKKKEVVANDTEIENFYNSVALSARDAFSRFI